MKRKVSRAVRMQCEYRRKYFFFGFILTLYSEIYYKLYFLNYIFLMVEIFIIKKLLLNYYILYYF